MFWRQCRQCRVVLTAEGANGGTAWLACKYHPCPSSTDASAAAASQWEQHARALAPALSDGAWVATESCLLGRGFGATDLVLAARTASGSRCWLAVEVDGETHFDRPYRGSSKMVRRQQDREKDERAWERRVPVVRLHHLDSGEWGEALLAAQLYARLPQVATFILYTRSYHGTTCWSQALLTDGRTVALNYTQVGRGWGGLWLTSHCFARRQPVQSWIQKGPSTPSFQCTPYKKCSLGCCHFHRFSRLSGTRRRWPATWMHGRGVGRR